MMMTTKKNIYILSYPSNIKVTNYRTSVRSQRRLYIIIIITIILCYYYYYLLYISQALIMELEYTNKNREKRKKKRKRKREKRGRSLYHLGLQYHFSIGGGRLSVRSSFSLPSLHPPSLPPPSPPPSRITSKGEVGVGCSLKAEGRRNRRIICKVS